ncbi:MAG TPA: TPM domain-containing protein [Ignavibacteria bacterium]|nr:TPM domain-containing protein [Ignavibacteria bacterium]
MKRIILLIIYSLILTSVAYQQESGKSLIDSPSALTEYVTDNTGTLTAAQLVSLRNKLRSFFDSTSTQIVVYMIPSLNGEPIEEVALNIAVKNKIGRKGSNNGVLLLIAKNDRKLRIEVGYGLEGALTDALSKLIIKNEISPSFKTGDYYAGIEKGVNAIFSAVKGEYSARDNNEYNKNKSADYTWLAVAIPMGVIFISIFLGIVFGRKSGSGGYVSGSGYSSSSYSSSSYSSSDSYSSSSSSSDSGFSGGGGDFGGGGASGDW